MTDFISWDSQPIDVIAKKYAKGKFIDLNGRSTHYIEKGYRAKISTPPNLPVFSLTLMIISRLSLL